MKQFIYLDTDIVTSIIAQEEKGYVIQQTEENEVSSGNTGEKSLTISADAKGGAKLWKFLQAEADLGVSGEFQKGTANQTSTKDIAEKRLHDAAFDIAYSYISPTNVSFGDESVGEEGQYLELQRVFDYVDFDYLLSLFDKDGVIDLIKKSEAEGIENEAQKARQELNRDQFRKAGSKIKSEISKAINISNKQYDDVHMIIKAVRGLIPYSRMLISNDGFLIPLDDKYFRINPTNLGFKYGGEMKCVGMVTNIIGKDTNPCDAKNVFATIQFSANEVLRSILPTKNENICVIHPIAIYYGN